jgi:hypothetical protein
MLDTTAAEDARAFDLIAASGVLNPNLTMDTLMDVSRQLAELELASGTLTDARPIEFGSYQVFAGSFYVYKQLTR